MSRADHLLLIQVPITGQFGTERELASLRELEDKISEQLNLTRYGELDGDEIGAGGWSLFVIGKSAQRLWDSLSDVILSHGLPAGSRASLRRYSAVWGQPDKIIPLSGPKAGTPIQRAKLSALDPKRVPHPGDVYAVGFQSGGLGIGVVAAVTTSPGIEPYACFYGLGKFFESQPKFAALRNIGPLECTFPSLVACKVLRSRSCAYLGRLQRFNPELWPMPVFGGVDDDVCDLTTLDVACLPRPLRREKCTEAEARAVPRFRPHESQRWFCEAFDLAVRRITPRGLGGDPLPPHHFDIRQQILDSWREVQSRLLRPTVRTVIREARAVTGSVAAVPLDGGGFGLVMYARVGRGRGAIAFGMRRIFESPPTADVLDSLSIKDVAVVVNSLGAADWPHHWYPLGRIAPFSIEAWPVPPSLDRPALDGTYFHGGAAMIIHDQATGVSIWERMSRAAERAETMRFPSFSGWTSIRSLENWIHLSVREKHPRFHLVVDAKTLELWKRANSGGVRSAAAGAMKGKSPHSEGPTIHARMELKKVADAYSAFPPDMS